MNFNPGFIYHVYNRGNNRQKIFYYESNYRFFISKISKDILPLTDVLAYCLMPYHYHLMFVVKEIGNEVSRKLSRKIGTLQSSYTRAINIQKNTTGSLFQQKAKAIEISSINNYRSEKEYLTSCFHYIHQNPLKAGLVAQLKDWKYSSYREYLDFGKAGLVNKVLAKEIIDIDWNDFYEESYRVIDKNWGRRFML